MAASLAGGLHGSTQNARDGAPLPPPGGAVALEGWIEAELDGGALLHTRGPALRLRRGRVGDTEIAALSGTAVRVTGAVDEPWHPRAPPAIVVHDVAPWQSGGVTAPGIPPLTRGWMRLRLATREAMRSRLQRLFPRRAGLAAALVLADRSALPSEVRDAFTASGTAHLLAISGFHVGILAGWVLLGLGLLGVRRRVRPPLATLLVWGYVALLGFPTSSVRAALLIAAVSLGRLRGRPVHGLGAWGLALAVVALVDPTALRGAGAQLSFAGSLGLILWARPWGRVLGGEPPGSLARWPARVRYVVGMAVAASAAAQVMTLPLVAWHFQRIPLAALPASVSATPLVAVALPGMVVSLLLDLIWRPAAQVVASGADVLLGGTVFVVNAIAGVRGVVWASPSQVVVVLGGGLAGAAWAGRYARRRRSVRESGHVPHVRVVRQRRLRGALAGGMAAGLLAPGLWAVVGGAAGRGAEIRVLDVGQGDAIAIRSPRGAWVLVDAGPGDSDALLRQLARNGVTRIETLVLTHPDLDHIGGAADVLRTVRVGRVVGPGLLRGTEAMREAVEAAGRAGVPWGVVEAGEVWDLDGVELRVLHAGGVDAEPNDQSIVLHVRFGGFDALLTGDISSSVEDLLPGQLSPQVSVEVLKVAHHGSRTSTSAAFLNELRPEAAVISVGRRNRFGHPAPEVMRRIRQRAIPWVSTATHGTVRLRIQRDGTFRISGEFGGPLD